MVPLAPRSDGTAPAPDSKALPLDRRANTIFESFCSHFEAGVAKI